MKSLAFACIAYLKKQNLLSKTKAKILINPKKAWGGGGGGGSGDKGLEKKLFNMWSANKQLKVEETQQANLF